MGILDRFTKKRQQNVESNALFGQTLLGNNVLRNVGQGQSFQQMLYVTTSGSTTAGRVIDIGTLSRNSTVMSCVNVKARALAQLPIRIMAKSDSGEYVDACNDPSVSARDRAKARSVQSLLTEPNNFQSQYEFWYQTVMWLDLLGESFVLLWRKNQKNAVETPIEMYVLDSTLITAQLTETRYPTYRLSTPSYGFSKEQPLEAHQVIHLMEAAWQGSGGFNKGTQAVELVALDQDIDIYANYIMQNGAKPSGIFRTEQVIPDAKYKEIAARIKEAWSQLTGSRATDPSKPGQGMLLDQGMTYESIKPLTLQDADAAELKMQTMKRICGLFGVPPQMIGVAEGKYNNSQTMLDEFYKSTMAPMIRNIEQKLKGSLLKGFPNLSVRFDTADFLKGAPLDQMNYVVAGIRAGILTANEAREYLGLPNSEDAMADALQIQADAPAIAGSSPQDTGGGGNTDVIGKRGRAGKA